MGTIVVGKVEAGHIKKGQQVVIMPNKVKHLEIVMSFLNEKANVITLF